MSIQGVARSSKMSRKSFPACVGLDCAIAGSIGLVVGWQRGRRDPLDTLDAPFTTMT